MRTLLDDLVRQRLWPIAVVAVAVMIAVPLLFLRPAGEPAPAPAPAAPAVSEAELPAKLTELLGIGGDKVAARERERARRGAARDPFQAPRGRSAAAAKPDASAPTPRPAPTPSPGAPAPSDPVPVIITGPGTEGGIPVAPAPRPGPAPSPAPAPEPTAEVQELEPQSDPAATGPSVTHVDVRFGKRADSPLRRSIDRNSPLPESGVPHAVFVKYSPARDKAVFAVAPGTMVTGPVRCRRKAGVCRYVDIPAGSYARLTLRRSDGRLVRRRLDVVRIHRSRAASAGAARRDARGTAKGRCVLRKVRALAPDHGWHGLVRVDALCEQRHG